MNRLFRTVILLIAASCSLAANAVMSDFMVQQISLGDGLSQSSVKCILRDPMGYLWIGTSFGLNRYDNDNITGYYADPHDPRSLAGNEVHFVAAGEDGTLLVGSGRNVQRYDYNSNDFETLTENGTPIDGRSAKPVRGGILIGGFGKLFYYENATGLVHQVPIEGGSSSAYTGITNLWKSNTFILHTRWDGLWTYNTLSGRVERLAFCHNTDIISAFVDDNGYLWVSEFNNGLKCYSPNGKLIKHLTTAISDLSSNIIRDIAQHRGRIWLATEQGIDIINPNDFKIRHMNIGGEKISGSSILCLTTDTESVYAGTVRHGAVCLFYVPMRTIMSANNNRLYDANGFSSTSILEDPNSQCVYVGLDGDGVILLDLISGTVNSFPQTDRMKVTSLARIHGDNILISDYGRDPKVLNPTTGQISPVPVEFRNLDRFSTNKANTIEFRNLSDGRILAISDALVAIDPSSHSARKIDFTEYRAMPRKLNPFFCDGSSVLVYDEHSIYRYDARMDTIGAVLKVLPRHNITAAAFCPYELQIWYATEGGLFHYDSRSCTTTRVSLDGIKYINAIALEDGRIWLGADNKVHLYTGHSVTSFDRQDGVYPNQFINKASLITDDYVLMGGVNGVLKINRKNINDLTTDTDGPTINLSEIEVDGRHLPINKRNRYTIPSEHSTVTVGIIDSHPHNMHNYSFRFYVDDGSRESIFEQGGRQIALNMLPPGTYHISVAYNRYDGSWSDPTEVATLRVSPPWWLSWWAITIYVVILLSAIAGCYTYYLSRRRRDSELATQRALKDKVDFLSKIHSELRTPLNMVLSPLNSLIERIKSDPQVSESTISTLRDIYDNAEQMRVAIDTLPETHDLSVYMSTLKADSKADSKPDPKPDPEANKEVEIFDTTSYCAIVVEDNRKFCAYLVSELQHIFKQVIFAHNASDAMIRINESHPDIVITDMDLKGRSGFDLCRDIKQNEKLSHIPVVVLTQGNSKDDKRKSYDAGADGYLSKPFDIDVLISRCRNLIRNRTHMRRRYEAASSADPTNYSEHATNSDETFIMEVRRLISEGLSDPDFGVEYLAKKMLMSRTAFYSRMRTVTGRSIGQYIAEYRLEQAQIMLRNPTLSINEISERLGFRTQRYFSTFFKERTGMSPSEFRK